MLTKTASNMLAHSLNPI